MHYRLLFRPPLVYVTITECVLIAAIIALTLHIWHSRQPGNASPGQAAVAAQAGPAATSTSSRAGRSSGTAPTTPIPSPFPAPGPGSPQAGPTPGTRTDSAFVSRQMNELNRVEATFEDLEWRMTKAIADGIEHYVEHVVLPSIDRSVQHDHP